MKGVRKGSGMTNGVFSREGVVKVSVTRRLSIAHNFGGAKPNVFW